MRYDEPRLVCTRLSTTYQEKNSRKFRTWGFEICNFQKANLFRTQEMFFAYL